MWTENVKNFALFQYFQGQNFVSFCILFLQFISFVFYAFLLHYILSIIIHLSHKILRIRIVANNQVRSRSEVRSRNWLILLKVFCKILEVSSDFCQNRKSLSIFVKIGSDFESLAKNQTDFGTFLFAMRFLCVSCLFPHSCAFLVCFLSFSSGITPLSVVFR